MIKKERWKDVEHHKGQQDLPDPLYPVHVGKGNIKVLEKLYEVTEKESCLMKNSTIFSTRYYLQQFEVKQTNRNANKLVLLKLLGKRSIK